MRPKRRCTTRSGLRSSSGRRKACREILARGWCQPGDSKRLTPCGGANDSTRLDDVGDAADVAVTDTAAWADEESVEDDRLRLIFTCCHPALAPDAQVALTLREVCGLTTEEIAQAFLTPAPTLAQRIVRAKSKIRDAKIPYQVPTPSELPDRLDAVLRVIYLVFNEGYTASSGAAVTRHDLSTEAIRLGRLLVELLPEPEARGLLALMLLHESRRAARTSPDGDVILLDDQDRSLWDRKQIAEGVRLVEQALSALIAFHRSLACAGRKRSPKRQAVRAVCDSGGDCRRARRGADTGGNRLERNRGPVRRIDGVHAVAGCRAESRGRCRHARRSRCGARARRRDPEERRACGLPARPRRARGAVPAPWKNGGCPGVLPTGVEVDEAGTRAAID